MKLYKKLISNIWKNNLLPLLFFVIIIMLLPLMGISQDPPGPGDTGGGNPDGSVPIDGGLSLVIAVGVGYGAKKIRDYNKKKKEEAELDGMEL